MKRLRVRLRLSHTYGTRLNRYTREGGGYPYVALRFNGRTRFELFVYNDNSVWK